ncbi:MAG TPA: DUF1453 domain-containing protein [Pseudonocardiaceae bacterium]|jgi:hypothetical protein
MSGALEIVIIIAVVIYMLISRMMGQPAQAKRMLLLPAILTVVGVTELSGVNSATSVVFLVATAAISVVLGAARGFSVRISQRDGIAFVRYTGWTVALWVLNIAVKFGANFALGAIDGKAAAGASNSVMITIGLGLLVEGLVVLYRAMRANHPVVWSQSRDGQRQMSPVLDNMRRNFSSGQR